MTVKDCFSRDHELNPRKYPMGIDYPSYSRNKFPRKIRRITLLGNSEMNFIWHVPKLLGNALYANLGHARGGSAILMADCIRTNKLDAKVYSIDLFPSNKFIQKALYYIQKFDVEEWIELCFGSTIEWADKLQDKRFSFVFIDANHTYEAVRNDFINWAPLVAINGWISFHDTNQTFTHQAIEDAVLKDKQWKELKDYHINSIRTFEKIEI
ncbi:MAG: class I SAM-dependent methyltransferase [Promethearchaeota archaeon]